MNLFIKIFFTIFVLISITFLYFTNYVLNKQRVLFTNKLENKIQYNEKVYFSLISELLFDLNFNTLNNVIYTLYEDEEIIKVVLTEKNDSFKVLLDNSDIDNTNNIDIIKSIINLEYKNIHLGKLEIFYSKKLINQNIKTYKNNIFKFAIFINILLFFVLLFFTYKFSKSIKKLIIATREISSGNLDYKIEVSSNDEIGELSKQFNLMKNSLQIKSEEINDELRFQELLLDLLDFPIFIKDNKGNILNCNKCFLNFFNLTKNRTINKRIDILFENKLFSEFNIKQLKLLENENNKFDIKLYNLEKESRDFVVFKNNFTKNNDKVHGHIYVLFDVTTLNKAIEIKNLNNKLEFMNCELKNSLDTLNDTQDKLIQSEKMASLGALVAGVSHEINTPIGISLTGITHLDDITKNIFNDYKNNIMSEEDFEDYINVNIKMTSLIVKNLEKAASLVQSFKKIAVDQSSEDMRTFNLKEYLDEILDSLYSIAKKVKLNIVCPDNIILKSYPGTYSQIITNLVVNSVTHGFKNRNDNQINISVEYDNDELILIYKDNGSGISNININKIFDPFFTTNRDNGGSGLGLNIIYNLVTVKLEGSITCKSSENKGVEFRIALNIKNTL